MNLEEFKKSHHWPFPDSYEKPTCRFGLDPTTFADPRYHNAVDIALPYNLEKRREEYPVICPIKTTRTKWWGPQGAHGTTWLDLYFNGGYWRFAHLYRDEMDETARALILQGLPLDKGNPIGPAGDAGLSVSNNGCSARHLHAVLCLDPTEENYAILDERWGLSWRPEADKIPGWRALPGGREVATGYDWANEHTAGRLDPFTRRYTVAVDWYGLLFN